ncbi:MAG: WecB/TagA/CpsF family glycosyltransferase [Minisyncoccota bacterium]
MEMLGIPIDCLTRKEIVANVQQFLSEPIFHRVTTINPEFLLEAEKNIDFRTALLTADMRVVDGFGIVFVGWLLRWQHRRRFTGVDLMEVILRTAQEKQLSLFLAINKDGLSSYREIRSVLLKQYPNINIHGKDIDPTMWKTHLIIDDSIVLCNFGAPTQEIFLDNLKNQHTIRLAIGVGGALDYLTGKQKRAPNMLRIVGLEWCWRLIQQPKRWKRIWCAVIVFPFRVISTTIHI